ncbi:MAG: tRNA lysidine(34) synthetase TilS [Firmicutes bacterium]|nr:tRNA lysidine(34) synthetase TilS [Bacillota bacterium]
MDGFTTKIRDFIVANNMISSGDTVSVGVSGGADSLAMLYVLNDIKEDMGFDIRVVHVNHNIRGKEAYDDELFVKETCENLSVPFYPFSFNVEESAKKNGLTVEEEGRRVRYLAFSSVGANKIAVAHNKNDNCETMLMRFFRGTGIKGLGGIHPVRGNIIRPLLCVTRKEIEDYCHCKNLKYRTDSTNLTADYTRNKIRLDIIPEIEKYFNPSFTDTMYRSAEIFKTDEEYILKNARLAYKRCMDRDGGIFIDKFLKEDEAIQRRVLRLGFINFSPDLHDISYEHINSIYRLTESENGKVVHLPHNLRAKREFDKLYFYVEENNYFEKDINIENEIFVENINKYFLLSTQKRDGYSCIIDMDKIKSSFSFPNFKIRAPKTGDKIYLNGIKGRKSLKKIFSENKMGYVERCSTPLLTVVDENKAEEILWIEGLKTNDMYKAEEKSLRKVYLYERQNYV